MDAARAASPKSRRGSSDRRTWRHLGRGRRRRRRGRAATTAAGAGAGGPARAGAAASAGTSTQPIWLPRPSRARAASVQAPGLASDADPARARIHAARAARFPYHAARADGRWRRRRRRRRGRRRGPGWPAAGQRHHLAHHGRRGEHASVRSKIASTRASSTSMLFVCTRSASMSARVVLMATSARAAAWASSARRAPSVTRTSDGSTLRVFASACSLAAGRPGPSPRETANVTSTPRVRWTGGGNGGGGGGGDGSEPQRSLKTNVVGSTPNDMSATNELIPSANRRRERPRISVSSVLFSVMWKKIITHHFHGRHETRKTR